MVNDFLVTVKANPKYWSPRELVISCDRNAEEHVQAEKLELAVLVPFFKDTFEVVHFDLLYEKGGNCSDKDRHRAAQEVEIKFLLRPKVMWKALHKKNIR